MQITSEQLLEHARNMALELRLKDEVIMVLERRIAELTPPPVDSADD